MGLIIARIKVKCPKTGQEVDMINDCYKCEAYAHFGLQGPLIIVMCALAPREKGEFQKETERIKKIIAKSETRRWLQQAREEGRISDEEKTERS